ncbi:hypothetical protein NC652_041257 [Populus alba x Populus x berolinensis]|uniref:Uncharacterized protein n=1 Tax=Populus alba TaxID=43335 RepID=A0ACC4AGV5_POPAL|nr:hypothetical protein NC652_041257 [Populus alba x Populus x berolinensis]
MENTSSRFQATELVTRCFHVNGQQGKWEEKPKVDWVTTRPVHARWHLTVQEIDRPLPYNNNKEKPTPYGGGGPSGRLDVVN